MRFVTASREPQKSGVICLGIFCVALVVFTGILQVAHSHPNGQIDHDCSLCVSAHNAVQIVVAVALVFWSRRVAWQAPRVYKPAPRQRFVMKLANRPPPVLAAFSA